MFLRLNFNPPFFKLWRSRVPQNTIQISQQIIVGASRTFILNTYICIQQGVLQYVSICPIEGPSPIPPAFNALGPCKKASSIFCFALRCTHTEVWVRVRCVMDTKGAATGDCLCWFGMMGKQVAISLTLINTNAISQEAYVSRRIDSKHAAI